MTMPGAGGQERPLPAPGVSVNVHSTAASAAAQAAASELVAAGVPAALAAGDPRLWGAAAEKEAAQRLGWLRAPHVSRALLPGIAELAERVRSSGLDRVVLAGMGGSSLAPEVITRTAGASLTVLDTTDPHQVSRVLQDRLEATVLVVSSKSGSTIETDSHRRIYAQAFAGLGLDEAEIARRIVTVTDPGSPLERLAGPAGYAVIRADPEVGGRYSALTAFGLVPSALAGVDAGRLLDEAEAASADLASDEHNPGLMLGAALGGFAVQGHDKAVIADCGSGITGFGDWAEQLIAESTGKDGRGILPVVVAGESSPGFSPGPDTHLIGLGHPSGPVDTSVAGPLGAQFLIWEYAVAVAGRICGIDPFNQPNVAESKQNTARLLAEAGDGPLPARQAAFTDGAVEVYAEPSVLAGATNLAAALDALLMSLPAGGYLAIMAYLDRTGDQAAGGLRDALAARTPRPVTFGWGPRFLHSTGQYHKGGPANGAFLQITGAIHRDLPVPGQPFSLGRLQRAQALGDLDAIGRRGRPVVWLHLRDRAEGLGQLLDAAGAATRGAGR